jgi:hypothetical protein
MTTTSSELLQPYLTEAPCTRCAGTGSHHSEGFTSLDGKVYPPSDRTCCACHGRGAFPGVDIAAVLDLLLSKRGAGKGRFRRSWPSKLNPWRLRRSDDVTTVRAYYVWRLARFHGGADVTMPVTASTVIAGDPHLKLLDAMADRVAKSVFGTDRAAMYRWGNLLGFVKDPPPDGLPESAYEGGRVVTSGQKPSFESEEIA